jgi:hypothetical protein
VSDIWCIGTEIISHIFIEFRLKVWINLWMHVVVGEFATIERFERDVC